MELELEMGPGKVQGASRCFLTTWRSAQRLCRGVGKACQPRALLECQPVPPRRGYKGRAANQRPWNESKLQRKQAAAFHTSIDCFDAHCALSGRRQAPLLWVSRWLMPRAASESLDHLDLDHKPCAVSRRKFRQAGGVMAASFVSPVNILNVFFFLSFFFVRITEPVLEVLIYFHVNVPVPGNAGSHSSSWDRIRLKSPWAPSVPLPGRDSSLSSLLSTSTYKTATAGQLAGDGKITTPRARSAVWDAAATEMIVEAEMLD